MSYIDPYYSTGEFIAHTGGSRDAAYKIGWISNFLFSHREDIRPVHYAADIGCGSGETTRLIREMLYSLQNSAKEVHGFDIHPKVDEIQTSHDLKFFKGDFFELGRQTYDLVFLLDVIEHILKPGEFLKELSNRCRWLIAIIPLDDSILTWIRNLPHDNLIHPGHISVFSPASAINLLTASGFRILDYSFVPVYSAPSGKDTRFQKMMYPIRAMFYRISPYLMQKTIGGTSLLVLAKTPIVEKRLQVSLADYPIPDPFAFTAAGMPTNRNMYVTAITRTEHGKSEILNEIASDIWALIDGDHSVQEIIDVIIQKYDVSPEQAEMDTVAFINRLLDKSICRIKTEE